MRRLVFRTAGLAAVTLLALAASTAAAHECMHDHPDLMNEQVRLLANPVAQQNYAHEANRNPGATLFNAQDAQPIRIAFNDEGLRRSGAYCTADGDQVPSYRTVGEKVPCGWFHVLTDEMRDRITQSILVPAINRIRTLVSVERIQGNLRIPSTQTCAETPIPDSHVSDGIADADLVLYLTSVPNPNFVSVWSGACLRDQNLRAIVGRLNFDPSVVRLGGGEAAVIEDVVHELLHILGVSSVEMFRADHKTIVQKRGKDVAVVKTPRVLSFVRSYTGCQELEGAEVEDEGAGATLSTGSHWERKVWFEEALNVMGGTKVSGLSLAFLADINVGYTINTNAGEAMIYGKGDGCGIHNNRCNTVEGGKDRYYCFEDPSNGGKTSQCSWDLKSVGFCAVNVWDEEFPPLYRYFPDWKRGGPKYMDGCPYVIEYANRQCSVPGPETEDDLLYPYVFESNSRCWDGVGVAKDGFSPYFEVGPRCLEGRCTNDGKSQFKSPDTNEWVTCSPQGTTAEMNGGYHGDIVCPSSFDMCRSLGASTTVTPPPSPTTTSAPVTTTTQAPVTTTTAAPTSPPSTATPPTDSPSNPTTQAPPGETTTSGPSPTSGAPTTTGSPSSPTTAAPGTPTNTNAPSTPSGSPSATTSAPQTPSSTPSATTGSPTVPMPPTTSAPVATEPVPSRTPSTSAPTGTPSSPTTTAAPGASPSPTDGNEGTTTQSPSATPTTPQPSTFSFAAQIVVQGSFFARIQGDAAAWQLLQDAVRADLAALLGVDVSRVVIGNMAIGSLIVNYTVSSSSSTEAGIALARSQTLASGNAQLPRTTAEYRKVSPQSGNLTVSQSTTESTDFGSDSSAASQTLVLGAMLLVAVTALVGFASA